MFVYNRALTSEEISAISAAEVKGKCKGVSFVNFSPSLQITLGPSNNDDSFNFNATGNEGPGTDGISPLTEDIGLRFGNFSLVIPAGSFTTSRNQRRLSYTGVIDGITVTATISLSGGGNFSVGIKGTGAELSGIVLPMNAELVIGNNGGITPLPVCR